MQTVKVVNLADFFTWPPHTGRCYRAELQSKSKELQSKCSLYLTLTHAELFVSSIIGFNVML